MFDATYDKFDVGRKDTEIDKNGITMAAIQALYKKIQELVFDCDGTGGASAGTGRDHRPSGQTIDIKKRCPRRSFAFIL